MARVSPSLFMAGMVMATPLAAQGRVVDLTGQPAAALDEPFSTITGLQEAEPGVVILNDMREQRLVRADLTRGTLTDVGRKGGGPGEWQLPIQIFRGTNGTLLIPDLGQSKLHVVSAKGTIDRSIPLMPHPESGAMMTVTVRPQAADARGRLFYTGAPIGPNLQPVDSVPIIRSDFLAASPTADTIAWVPSPRIRMSGGSGGNTRVTVGRPAPYTPRDLWQALPDGSIAIVRAKPYRVEIHDKGRRPVVGPAVDYRPVRIGPAERDAYRARQANSTGMRVTMGGSGGQQVPVTGVGDRPAIADEDFPDVMPPFENATDVVVSPTGEIWVRRTHAASDPTPVYDIFSATGQRVGTARLRPHSRVIAFGTGSIYVVRQDPADDLLYVERYAVR